MEDSYANAGIDDKKRFELHFENLKDSYKEIVDNNFKMSAILLAVIAWFVSQKNPLGMLCESRLLTYFALAFTTVGLFLIAYLFHLIYQRSQNSYQDLIDLRYDLKLFRRYRVTRGMYCCGIFGHFTMLLGIFSLILVRYVIQQSITCK